MPGPSIDGLRIGRLECEGDLMRMHGLRLPKENVLSALVNLHLGLARELGAGDLDLQTLASGVRALLDDPRYGRCVLAWTGGEIVGQLEIKQRFEPWNNAEFWFIDNFVVHPDYRSRGIGTAILRYAREWAHAEGIARIRLYVDQDNVVARGFYENRDFTTKGDLMEMFV